MTYAMGAASTAAAQTFGGTVVRHHQPARGFLELSSSAMSATPDGSAMTIAVGRVAGSAGAVSVSYSTADGTALAGIDYTAASGTLYWASGDTSSRPITIPLSGAAFSGTRVFTLALSNPSGLASVGTPGSATATITGVPAVAPVTTPVTTPVTPPVATPVTAPVTAPVAAIPCTSPTSSSFATTDGFGFTNYGNYIVSNNNWGGTSGQALWANAQSCWGVTTTATTDRFGIGSYPHTSRGWENNWSMMNQMSTPGTNDWTTRSGMGISVSALTKARVHWAFNAPATPMRWDALMDIYFHRTSSPASSMFYPQLDLMVEQAITDEAYSSSTYYSGVAASAHATQVTVGGNTYTIYIDNPSQVFNQAGGHTIEMFQLPTAFASNNNLATWGSTDAVTDVAAIIKYLMQSNPVDDAGKPLVNALGVTITSPLITPDLYLNAINAGFEIDDGTVFNTTAFCVAMQNEPDCN